MDRWQTLQTLVDPLQGAADRPCVLALHTEGVTHWTYGDLAEQTRRLAHGLADAGVGKGDYVALLASNGPEWLLVCMAILRAGAAVVPLDTQAGSEVLTRALNDSGTRLIFTTTAYTNRLGRLELEREVRPVLLDVAEDDERGWRALLSDTAADLPTVAPEDPAALFYTSGTTGVPKGVPLTHANLAYQLNAVKESGLIGADDRVMLPLPMYHVYPFTIGLLVPLAFGTPIILPQSLTGPQIFRALEEGQPTIIVGVPRLFRALYDGITSQVQSSGKIASTLFHANLKLSIWLRKRDLKAGKTLFRPVHKRFGPQLRMMASGGSALDPDLGWKLEGLGWDVAVGYGLTETSPLLTIKMPQALRLASAGKAIPGTELRLDTSTAGVDTESEAGPQASAEQQGEVLARGSGVFAGYRNQPDQTEKSFTDGWFRTGDLGFIDNDGFLYIRGRASTLIVTEGGKNIQPEPVEEAYQGHFYIKEIGVLQHDNQLVALVVPEMDEVNKRANGDTERAIREAINEQSNLLPAYQRVSDYAITPETLAKTNLGKLKRHVLAERYDLAKQGIVETGEDVGPLPLEDMSEQDRTLLENSAAREVWDWLANRYPDRRLSPDTSPQLDLGIDSLSWLNLTLDIRERTGVELSDEAIKRINTVRDLLNEVASESETAEGGATSMLAVETPDEVLSDEQKAWLQPPGPVLHVLGIVVFVLLRAVARLFFRLEVRGVENVPDNGPFVITPNHTSYLDAPTVASALSYTHMRQIHWAGSVDVMFSHPVMRFISRMSQTMPVAGEGTGTGRSSLAFASIVLKRKRSLVWFPEGRISPNAELLPFRQGIGLVLDQYQVPVVPVYIEGANEALPQDRMLPRFKKVSVTFGKPMKPGELAQQGQGERPAERIVQALHDQVVELKNNKT